MPDVSVDHEADAAYVTVRGAAVARTVDHGRFIADYNGDGDVVGIEIPTLQRLPEAPEILRVLPGDAEALVRQGIEKITQQIESLPSGVSGETPPARGTMRRSARPD